MLADNPFPVDKQFRTYLKNICGDVYLLVIDGVVLGMFSLSIDQLNGVIDNDGMRIVGKEIKYGHSDQK